jgi:arylsulfatase A-like enzyme
VVRGLLALVWTGAFFGACTAGNGREQGGDSSAGSRAAMSGSETRPPNLLIVMPDQWRGQALGFLNEDPVVTPTLDTLATEGLVLTQAVVNYPVCSPARGMLMTGQYPHSNGVLGNANSGTAPYGYELTESHRTWSDILSEQGYSLGYIGKWHLDSPHEPYVESSNNTQEFAWNEWTPPERRHGFDFWYAYGTYDQHMRPMYWANDTPREGAFYVDQWGPEHEAEMAIRYLRNEDGEYRQPGRPFALVVAMNPPHMPYDQLPERYLEAYAGKTYRDLLVRPNVDYGGDSQMAELARNQTKNYFAMMTGVDEQLGRILAALDDEGLAADTIVLFTSDHGNCLGTHGQISKNNHYEESMLVPFLVRWPGKIPARQGDLLISTPDIFPTLLDLMGLGDEIPRGVEGTSRASILLGGEGERPTSQLYIWVPPGQPEWGRRGVRTHRYTLMISEMPDEPTETVLHDNLEDPYQLDNVAGDHPDIVQRLVEEELVPWLERTGDPWLERGTEPGRQ